MKKIEEQQNNEPICPNRQQMKESLLRPSHGVAGMVWHVGSDPGLDSLGTVIATEAKRSGFLSWIQGATKIEGMNIQPYYQPEIGLDYDPISDKIILNPSKVGVFELALTSPEGLDFHPKAAPGWHQVLANAKELGQIRLLKTQLATPSCSRENLSEELREYQPFIYRAIVNGHIRKAKQIASNVVMSLDDPQVFSTTTLRENLSTMFGDEFNTDGRLIRTETDVLRAIHCCGSWDMFGAMETNAIDIIHYDAWQYGPAPLIGKPDTLRTFVENNGLFAWGGIPQNFNNLAQLAKRVGLAPNITSKEDLYRLAKLLEEKIDEAVQLIFGDFLKWVEAVRKEAGVDERQIIRKTFTSATCGYGSNSIPPLRKFSYQLAGLIADQLYGIIP